MTPRTPTPSGVRIDRLDVQKKTVLEKSFRCNSDSSWVQSADVPSGQGETLKLRVRKACWVRYEDEKYGMLKRGIVVVAAIKIKKDQPPNCENTFQAVWADLDSDNQAIYALQNHVQELPVSAIEVVVEEEESNGIIRTSDDLTQDDQNLVSVVVQLDRVHVAGRGYPCKLTFIPELSTSASKSAGKLSATALGKRKARHNPKTDDTEKISRQKSSRPPRKSLRSDGTLNRTRRG